MKRPLRHLIEYVLDDDVSLEYVDAMKETSLREQRPAKRILIADDHQLMADACKNRLEPDEERKGIRNSAHLDNDLCSSTMAALELGFSF